MNAASRAGTKHGGAIIWLLTVLFCCASTLGCSAQESTGSNLGGNTTEFGVEGAVCRDAYAESFGFTNNG